MTKKEHKGWHSRGYLPHFDAPSVIQAVTFRLADALPKHVLEAWQGAELGKLEMRNRVAAYLDRGHGSCLLGHPAVARVVKEMLLRFDGERYELFAWVCMPNHYLCAVAHKKCYVERSVMLSRPLRGA